MKRIVVSLLMAIASVPSYAADVGVSIGFDQPGLYGRIDIGRVPAPPLLVYQQPVVILPSPVAVQRRPIYMHVPPGHAKRWKTHCSRYGACGQPVYFVQEGWYRDVYAPVHHGDRGDHHSDKQHRKQEKEHWKQHRKQDKKHGKKYDH